MQQKLSARVYAPWRIAYQRLYNNKKLNRGRGTDSAIWGRATEREEPLRGFQKTHDSGADAAEGSLHLAGLLWYKRHRIG